MFTFCIHIHLQAVECKPIRALELIINADKDSLVSPRDQKPFFVLSPESRYIRVVYQYY